MKTFKRAVPVLGILGLRNQVTGLPPAWSISLKTGLAPIYLAIAVLLSVSMFGFVIAAWPESSAASARLLDGSDPAPAMHPLPQSMQPAWIARGSGSRMRWM